MALDEATALINDLVSENTSDGKFITFCWGILDDDSKKFTYVNAGQNPPLLIRKNRIIKLTRGGIILGVMKTVTPYEYQEIDLEKDDVIIMFTDGVSEAMNRKKERSFPMKDYNQLPEKLPIYLLRIYLVKSGRKYWVLHPVLFSQMILLLW